MTSQMRFWDYNESVLCWKSIMWTTSLLNGGLKKKPHEGSSSKELCDIKWALFFKSVDPWEEAKSELCFPMHWNSAQIFHLMDGFAVVFFSFVARI